MASSGMERWQLFGYQAKGRGSITTPSLIRGGLGSSPRKLGRDGLGYLCVRGGAKIDIVSVKAASESLHQNYSDFSRFTPS